jgi:hypothetical protein
MCGKGVRIKIPMALKLKGSFLNQSRQYFQIFMQLPVWNLFFPEIQVYRQKLRPSILIPVFLCMTVLFSMAGFFLKPEGLIGFEWQHYWGIGIIPGFYPPWGKWLIQLLTWNSLVGTTLAGFSLMVYLRSRHLLSAAISFFSLPLLWILFLGQVDGIVTAALLGLPYTIPLVLLKPNVGFFALLSRLSYVLFLVVFLLISFLIFGFWPVSYLTALQSPGLPGADQNIPLGIWWIPIALIGLWFSRGDMDMMMLSGLVALPYVIPYHFLPAVPSIARLKPAAAVAAVIFSWLPLSSNWIGPSGWRLGWIFIFFVWLNLAIQRYPRFILFHKYSKWFL